MTSTHRLADASLKSWGAWLACATLLWAVSFTVADAVTVLDSVLSVASAAFIAWLTFGIGGVSWYHRNWREKFDGNNVPLAVALFMNAVGLWAAVRQLMDVFDDKESRIGYGIRAQRHRHFRGPAA
ncbi:amino acid transporter [Metarhizium album ARSEF 1941]|uniref:Amino acid transporter n=1 Tax=Metarhizium album (strain ARSEF 1941) TaxID=1081103 RepID=A0A0B2WPF5_METAS|nr:amino acid transporter [Metarhizium album ARSEF 1941]KHN94870.1 amino acid transporter [Metarhizium album ARSEF 1941]